MATLPDRAATTPGLGRSLVPLLALALSMAIGFTVMNSFATVQDGAKAELGLSDTLLALIQGVGAAVPLVLFSIPVGILVDRYNRVRLLLALAGLWTAGTLLTAYAPGAGMLFAARMMTGIGTTGALTAALSLGADLCRPDQRGRALLIVSLGKAAGQAGAFALTGVLFGVFASGGFGLLPWRATHVALAGIALVLILPVLFLREPPRREVAAGIDAPFRILAGELWSRRRFLLPLFVGQVSVVMADAAAGIWAAPVLTRVYRQSPDAFAGWMGALVLAAGVGGAVIGGLAADWGQKSGRRGGVLIGAVAAAAIGTPAALFPIMGSIPSFAAALGTLILAGTVTGLITSVALTVLIPNELRGMCLGAFIAIAGLIGFGFAPTLVTIVSTALGGEAHLAPALAIVGTITSAVSVVAFFLAMRAAPLSAIDEPI
ncbi:MFS transporter [Nostoc sp. 3335mG]|nr:MFS transporter [Nostoc sp. 3335mG]